MRAVARATYAGWRASFATTHTQRGLAIALQVQVCERRVAHYVLCTLADRRFVSFFFEKKALF